MRSEFILCSALLVLSTYAQLTIDVETGTNVGFGLTRAAHGFGSVPTSALPFFNAAGVSKLMVPILDSIVVFPNTATDTDVSAMDSGATSTQSPNGGAQPEDITHLGNDIYLTSGTSVYQLNADGTNPGAPLHSFSEAVFGIVGNPTDGKLYVSSGTGVRTYDVANNVDAEPVLAPGLAQYGIALSPNYQTYYLAQHDADTGNDMVEGFNLLNGVAINVFRSSNVAAIRGVIAGTGCLSDYVFITSANQILQVSFRGVQSVIATDSVTSNRGGYLKFDPTDGSVLIPWSDKSIYRLTPPSCGGFAGPTKFVADAFPVGAACVEDTDCSSQHCGGTPTTTCQTSGYLGACQSNADCTNNGFFCQLPLSAHDNKPFRRHHSGKKGHRDDEDDFRRPPIFVGPGINPALYGVCEINLCVTNMGGCDTNAVCTPTGDRQRVCRCNEAMGFFGTGLFGQCVSPCDAINNGCDPQAGCTSLSSTAVLCTCPPNLWGAGTTASPCMTNPCDGNTECGAGTCMPTGTGANDFLCVCDDGYFLTDDTPRCVMDLCALNGGEGPCVANSFCTPGHNAGSPTTSCTCDPGYAASSLDMNNDPVSCIAAICQPLTVGVWPLADPHSTQGNCGGATTGQVCNFGCMHGWKPTGSTRAVCIPSQTMGTSIFSLTPFACERDDRDRDDDDHDDIPRSAWNCGIPPVSPCTPSAPYLERKDAANGSVKLRWLALGTSSPGGDIVQFLRIKVSPRGGIAFFTSTVANPTVTNTLVITGLHEHETYTFRLVVDTTNNGQTTGAPFTVEL